MSDRFLRLVVGWACFIACWAIPSEGHAGPLLDWLFHRRDRQQVAAYAAQPAGCCGAAYCEQTVVRYVPQVSYRTVWQPVPVTSYRRTTYCNPATGLPMTCVQPCTSYTYQARRVPYTAYRPVYSTVPVTMNYAANTSFAPIGGCGNCSTGFVAPATYDAPGYSVTDYDSSFSEPRFPSSAADSYVEDNPRGATPWRPVEPTPASPNDTDTLDRGSDYEDDHGNVRPKVPRIQSNSFSRSVNRIPSIGRRSESNFGNDPYYARRGPASRDRYLSDDRDSSARDQIDRSGLSDRWQRFDSDSERRQFDRRGDDVDEVESSSHDGSSGSYSKGNRRVLDIDPVPNVDPPMTERRQFPELLNASSDREAARRARYAPTRWAVHRITWNTKESNRADVNEDGYAVRSLVPNGDDTDTPAVREAANNNRWPQVRKLPRLEASRSFIGRSN